MSFLSHIMPQEGILQARILKWVAIPFSRGSSWPRDRTWVSHIAGRFFIVLATREALHHILCHKKPQALNGLFSFKIPPKKPTSFFPYLFVYRVPGLVLGSLTMYLWNRNWAACSADRHTLWTWVKEDLCICHCKKLRSISQTPWHGTEKQCLVIPNSEPKPAHSSIFFFREMIKDINDFKQHIDIWPFLFCLRIYVLLEKEMATLCSILVWRIPRMENPTDGGAWRATVYAIANSQTRLGH